MKTRPYLLMFGLLAGAGLAHAADIYSDFDAANKLYSEGKFAGSAAAYDRIIQQGPVSAALFFNDGNAQFKAGHLGFAITAYRRAAELTPRDPDVRANLSFARNQVQGPTRRASRAERSVSFLSVGEWTAIVAVGIWLTFALLIMRLVNPSLRFMIGRFSTVAGMISVAAGIGFGLSLTDRLAQRSAIVIAPDAAAHSGPFDEAQNVFTAHDGAELEVLDQRNDWIQVTDGTQRSGWLKKNQVNLMPGA